MTKSEALNILRKESGCRKKISNISEQCAFCCSDNCEYYCGTNNKITQAIDKAIEVLEASIAMEDDLK